jgi:hypothetical protein
MKVRSIAVLILALSYSIAVASCSSDSGSDLKPSDVADDNAGPSDSMVLPEQVIHPDEIDSSALVIEGTASEFAYLYQDYSAYLECLDPDGKTITWGVGVKDTCGGEFSYLTKKTLNYHFSTSALQIGDGCVLEVVCANGSSTSHFSQSITVQDSADVADLSFSEPKVWANPITDYIEINAEELGHENFMKEIFDLAVFDGRLYFGYGDANLNLGRITPIELRYWAEPDPEAYNFDFIVDEEQVSRYRIFGDEMLIPGVDATEDDLLGNAYQLIAGGGEWYKSRTLQWGWHVHDIARTDDGVFAVGSGGSGDDYANSTVNAFVWKSTDEAQNFEVQVQLPHPNPPGDHRLVHLLPVGSHLYAFGYYSAEGMTYATAYEVVGNEVVQFENAGQFFVLDSFQLSGTAGLLAGVVIADPLVFGVRKVHSDGSVEDLESLADKALVNAEPLGDGRAVLLTLDGTTYPTPEEGPWTMRVGLINDADDYLELVEMPTAVRPVSVAFWRHSLYIGMADGSVWRASGTSYPFEIQ